MKKTVRFLALLLCLIAVIILAVYGVRLMYPVRHETVVTDCARKYGLEEELIFAVIKAESNFNETAVSKKGAVGLMQMMDTTGKWVSEQLGEPFQKEDLYDSATNIRFGAYYLSYLLDRYRGDKTCAIAAYNAGHANVDAWLLSEKYSDDGKTLENIPFAETKKYVRQVLKFEKVYQYLYGEK